MAKLKNKTDTLKELEKENSSKEMNKYLSIEEFHHLMYLLEPVFYDSGDIVIEQGTLTDKMIVVASGKLHCTTKTTYLNNLGMVTLSSGAILDSLNVHINKDLSYLTVKAIEQSMVYELTKEKFEEFKAKHPVMNR